MLGKGLSDFVIERSLALKSVILMDGLCPMCKSKLFYYYKEDQNMKITLNFQCDKCAWSMREIIQGESDDNSGLCSFVVSNRVKDVKSKINKEK